MACRNICLRYPRMQVSYIAGGKYCRRCEYCFFTERLFCECCTALWTSIQGKSRAEMIPCSANRIKTVVLLFLLNVWPWIENHPNRTYFPIIDMKPKTHKGCYWRRANFNLLENTDIVAIREYLLDVEFGFSHSSHLVFKIFHV